MPSKFNKVQKRVTKKKGAAIALHENSRDALRLRSAVARDDKVIRASAVREKANEPWLHRIIFLQDEILPNSAHATLTPSALQSAILVFLARHSPTLTALASERRPGRPKTPKHALLEQLAAQEEKEYDNGFWMPDLRDEGCVVKLKAWKRDWAGLSQLRYVRVHRDGRVVESAFPPKGAA